MYISWVDEYTCRWSWSLSPSRARSLSSNDDGNATLKKKIIKNVNMTSKSDLYPSQKIPYYKNNNRYWQKDLRADHLD